MKVKNQIPQSIITAAVAMLSQFVPDISPTRLIAALQEYNSEGKEQNHHFWHGHSIDETGELFRFIHGFTKRKS